MASDVSSFPSYATYSQYSPYGRDYGNPLFNAAMFAMFGNNYAPKPEGQQDYTDAEMQRIRSREFMDLQGSAFSHNMLFKMAGFNPESNLLQFAGKAFGSPDGAVAGMLSPLIGGNPMAATQQLYAGLQGANIMGAFGRPEGVSSNETKKMMEILNKSFYKQQNMEDTVDKSTGEVKKGVTTQMNEEFVKTLLSNPDYARQEGIGIPKTPTGAEDTRRVKELKNEGKKRKELVDELLSTSDKLDLNEAKRGTNEFNEKLSKDLNEHIKKALKEAGKITDEQLKTQLDANGIVKKEVIKKAADQQLTRSEIESAGLDYEAVKNAKLSDLADPIHEKRVSRNIRLNIINNARRAYDNTSDEIDALNSKENKTEADEKRLAELKKNDPRLEANRTIKQQLIAAGISEKEIDQHTSKPGWSLLGKQGKTDKIDTDYLNEVQEKLGKRSYMEYKADQYRQYKEAGGRFSGINFENTRGFNMEDFTSSFKTATELNLLGSKGSPSEKFEGFMQNSGGALSAARGIFGGNLSGGQLTAKISDLLGSKAGDMSTQQGSQEIEKFLRDMKATARVAGVSMNAMLDTIEAAKDLAKNNPRLQFMSAAATTDMTVKAFQTVSAMSGVMSSADVRRAGGTQGMVSAQISEEQKLLSSNTGQSLVALRQRFAGDPEKSAALERALGKFEQTGVNGRNINQVVDEIMKQPEMKGVSRGDIFNSMNNSGLREMGMKNDEFVNKTKTMMTAGLQDALYAHIFNNQQNSLDKAGFEAAYSKAKAENDEARKKDPAIKELTKGDFKAQFAKKQMAEKYAEAKKKNDEARKKDPTVKELTVDDFVSSNFDAYSLNVYRQMPGKIQEGLLRQVNPEYFKTIDRKRASEAKLDAELDKKFGGRNAPVITQIVSALAEGGPLNENKTNQLLDVFAQEKSYTETEKANLTAGFGAAIAATGEENLSGKYEGTAKGLAKATGEKVTAEDIKTMATAGFEAEDVDKAKERLANLRKIKPKDLGETQKMELAALEKEEKLGILSSKKAYETGRNAIGQGHDASAITAATIEGQKDKKILAQFEETKKSLLHGGKDSEGKEIVGLDQQLSEAAKTFGGAEGSALSDAIATYKGNDEKLIQDATEDAGVFKKGGELEKKLGAEKFGMIKQSITETSEKIKQSQEKALGETSGAKKEGSPEDLSNQLKALTKGLDGSKLTKALELLASKV